MCDSSLELFRLHELYASLHKYPFTLMDISVMRPKTFPFFRERALQTVETNFLSFYYRVRGFGNPYIGLVLAPGRVSGETLWAFFILHVFIYLFTYLLLSSIHFYLVSCEHWWYYFKFNMACLDFSSRQRSNEWNKERKVIFIKYPVSFSFVSNK